MEDRTRFTTEQVLRGIQAYVSEHVDTALVIDPDASVNDYREAIELSHDCPLWFLTMLSEYFGFEHSETRWAVWLKLKATPGLSKSERKRAWEYWQEVTSKTITVRKLAEHIADYAPGTSMKPSTVFGVECAPAGVFRGLCQLPEVRGKRVAPSTPLRSTLLGYRLRSFYGRSEWISGTRLPPLVGTYGDFGLPHAIGIALIFHLFAVPAGVGLLELFSQPIIAGLGALCAGVAGTCLVGFVVGTISDWLRNPLPVGINTFGDLARVIANGGAVS
ncbi:hypothetical protein [Aeoliella sp.]|uniref:hypothetical protein n=1 Tax=Aeoliella sp. TaxID=2795800 RepID=UPI003CCBD87E